MNVKTRKALACISAIMIMLSAVGGTFTTLAKNSVYVPLDSITLDGNLSEWTESDKFAMSVYDSESGVFTETSDEYCQFAWNSNRLYFALKVNDTTNTKDGLLRDHIRFSAIFPDGSIGLFYSDNDGWHNTGDCASWWGYTGTNVTIADNSMTSFSYNSDGTLTIEGSVRFTDDVWSKVKDGTELKIALQYFDYMSCIADAYNGNRWVTFGSENIKAITTDDINGVVKIKKTPFNYDTYAYLGDNSLGIDGSFTEWNITAKSPMTVYDSKTNKFEKSSDEYVQFRYAADGKLYFRVHAADSENTVNGLIRDQIRLTVFLPNSSEVVYYFDSDNWWVHNAGAWFGLGDDSGENNAAQIDQSESRFVYDEKSGFVDIEGRVNLKDEYKSLLQHEAVLSVAIEYFDSQTCNNAEFDGNHWAMWGTDIPAAVNADQVYGKVTLYDMQLFLDLNGDEIFDTLDIVSMRRCLLKGVGIKDVNLDGAGDIRDLIYLKKQMAYDVGSYMSTSVAVQDLGKINLLQYPDDEIYDWGQCVLKIDGKYKMWWTRGDPHDTVWYAESTDLKNWTNAQVIAKVTNDTTWMKKHIADPAVVYVNGTYYMYFESNATQSGSNVTDSCILMATSEDGINLNFYGGNDNPQPVLRPSDDAMNKGYYGVGMPSVIYKDGKFMMYYYDGASDSNTCSRLAVSNDGINFSENSENTRVFNRSGVGVAYNSLTRTYMMTYTLNPNLYDNKKVYNENIYFMESEDGINFTYSDIGNSAGNPLVLSNSNIKMRCFPGFVTNGQGIINTPTVYSVFTEGEMPDNPTDWWMSKFTTFEGHIAAFNPTRYSKHAVTLPNGNEANEENLLAYKD